MLSWQSFLKSILPPPTLLHLLHPRGVGSTIGKSSLLQPFSPPRTHAEAALRGREIFLALPLTSADPRSPRRFAPTPGSQRAGLAFNRHSRDRLGSCCAGQPAQAVARLDAQFRTQDPASALVAGERPRRPPELHRVPRTALRRATERRSVHLVS